MYICKIMSSYRNVRVLPETNCCSDGCVWMFTGMIRLVGISPSDISWDIGNQTSLAEESTISFDGFPSYKLLRKVYSVPYFPMVFPWFSQKPWFSHGFPMIFGHPNSPPFKIVPVSARIGSAPAAHSSVGTQSAAWKRPGQTSPVSRRVFWGFPLGIHWLDTMGDSLGILVTGI